MMKYIFGLLLALCVSSCSKRIEYEAPDIDTEKPNHLRDVLITPQWGDYTQPESLSVLIYNSDGTLYKSCDLPVQGGLVSLPRETYRFIVYNSQVESVSFSSLEVLGTALAQAQIGGSKSHYELPSPGRLYTSSDVLPDDVFVLKPPMVKRSFPVTLNLRSMVVGATYQVALHNLADVLNLSTGLAYHDSNPQTGLLQLDYQGFSQGNYVFTGRSFGGCLDPACQWGGDHNMQAKVDMTLVDGTQSSFLVDVTQAMLKAQQSATPLLVEVEVLESEITVRSTVGDWSSGVSMGEIVD